jgi:prepilin-type N-terminal cleavage/methylation domain-containing protein
VRDQPQAGYTLVEILLAMGISTLLMAGLGLVIYTLFKANNTSDSRLQASSQIRTFQLAFHDDVAHNAGTIVCANPCTTLTLSGSRYNQGATGPCSLTVTYAYPSPSPLLISRSVGGKTTQVARNVKAFAATVGADNSVTVTLTVQDPTGSFTETQVLYFDPRPSTTPNPAPTPSTCP